MIKENYSMKAEVTSNDVGPTRTLKPSSIMKFIQEAAGVHLRESGLSYEFMKERGIVFLVVKMAVKVMRHAACGEDITVTTWFEKLSGAKFIRDVVFLDTEGNKIIECKSVWVAANPATHRIVRPKEYPFEIPDDSKRAVNADFVKIELSENAEAAGKRKVAWSDIDYNYHMNNSVYADILCDFYPGGLKDKKIGFFQIDFDGEAKLSDIIDIKTEKTENGVEFLGTVNSKRCFKAYCE